MTRQVFIIAPLLIFGFVMAVKGQDYPAEGSYQPPVNFNFDDAVANAPQPPFLNLPQGDPSFQFQQHQSPVLPGGGPVQAPAGGQNFNLVTKVFTLPDGGVTTLQVPEFTNP